MKRLFQITFGLLGIYLLSVTSCVHEPVYIDDDMMPPVDTMDVDTLIPCDPATIYFERDILPILSANCAQSGCHDATTAEDDVVLDSYDSVISSDVVEAFSPGESELFEVITESDEDKRMPPPPNGLLAQSQINLIEDWILQGAKNRMCDDTIQNNCDTISVSYSGHVVPVILTHCRTCHSGPTPAGGYDFTSYSGVHQAVMNGRLLGAVRREQGYAPMPQGGAQLPSCAIAQFEIWVAAGAPNN